MPSLQELIKQKKNELESKKIQEEKKIISKDKKEIKNSKKAAEIPVTITTDFEKLTIDELRAYYIVICKKKPKHDSKQDKQYLANEIIKTLNKSI